MILSLRSKMNAALTDCGARSDDFEAVFPVAGDGAGDGGDGAGLAIWCAFRTAIAARSCSSSTAPVRLNPIGCSLSRISQAAATESTPVVPKIIEDG